MKFIDFIASVPALFIDGTLYVCAGLFAFLLTQFGTDEAAKYVQPVALFWMKIAIGSMANTALNLKMFRSTAFSEYQARKKATGDTEVIRRLTP